MVSILEVNMIGLVKKKQAWEAISSGIVWTMTMMFFNNLNWVYLGLITAGAMFQNVFDVY